jgi:2-hydroxy-3-keto-5-methylthiopentenyl-1-phosphate phosphatase
MKTLIQCDFDGTITEDDASYIIFDNFALGDWRQLLRHYRAHKISVAQFNTAAFAMVKADKETLLEAIKERVKPRAGFHELVTYCSRNGFRLVVISNGADFYIEAVLQELGLANIEIHAAQASFYPEGVKVRYIGPNGKQLDTGLKEAYIRLFLQQGYKIIYIGDGESDIPAAKYAHQILARAALLDYCNRNNLRYKPFNDFYEVIRTLELG